MGATLRVRYAVVEIAKLRPHEQTEAGLLARTLAAIKGSGVLRRPVLVEDEHLVILDGHHRYEALKSLGCTRIPVFLVDYDDPAITVTTWPNATVASVTKADVVAHGTRGELFPPKTTRHTIGGDLEDVPVPIDDLR